MALLPARPVDIRRAERGREITYFRKRSSEVSLSNLQCILTSTTPSVAWDGTVDLFYIFKEFPFTSSFTWNLNHFRSLSVQHAFNGPLAVCQPWRWLKGNIIKLFWIKGMFLTNPMQKEDTTTYISGGGLLSKEQVSLASTLKPSSVLSAQILFACLLKAVVFPQSHQSVSHSW